MDSQKSDKLILDGESIEYFESIKSQIESKFQEYKLKLQAKQENLLNKFYEKICETQQLFTSINEIEKNLMNTNEKSKVIEETKLLKETLNSLCDKIEKLEQTKETFKTSKLSDVIEIRDDDFCIKFKIVENNLNSGNSNNLKSPASKPTRNICRKCGNQLEWNYGDFSNHCNCSNTNSNYKYGCETCEISYCTTCSYPNDITTCGCGLIMERTNVYNNYCDICRTNIRESCRRCDDCDYDVCDACYEKNK